MTMRTTVLGKRTRKTTERAGPENALARSKRRIVLNEPNDENQNPFVRRENVDKNGEDGMEIDEPVKKKVKAGERAIPAKHGPSLQHVAHSPSTINAHFKVAKPTVQILEDGKADGLLTPKTPRHRDAVSKKVAVTPRSRVLLAGSQLTPRIPRTPSNGNTLVYQQARQLFSRSSNPAKLVGRDEERVQLSAFISAKIQSKSAGCLYVSGPPGTGKSAFVEEVSKLYEDRENLKMCFINCMSIKNVKNLSEKLSENLGLSEGDRFEHLRSCFIRGKARDDRKYLVILDEVDRLVDLDLELLYDLFDWSMQASSRLILLGVANALDLTDRFLPRLKSRNLKPELLPFMPYSAPQIAQVLTTKLNGLFPDPVETLPFFHPSAIQFCAKKVSSQTGDLRKAFDICRRAIDLVEQDTKERDAELALQDSPSKTPLMENINLSSPPIQRSPNRTVLPTYTLETAPKVTIAHLAKITAQVFGNGTTQRLSALNLQQKAVLCALSALEKRKRDSQVEKIMFATPSKYSSTAPTIKQLFEAYSNLCKRENLLHPLTGGEFRDVVFGLETLSLITAADGKNSTFAVPITPSKTPSRRGKGGFGTAAMGDEKRVASAVGQKELSNALEGAGGELLREILYGCDLL